LKKYNYDIDESFLVVSSPELKHPPLHEAVLREELERVNALLKEQPVNSRNSFLQTPLMLAAHKGNERILYLLLEKGANLYLTDEVGRDVLHYAISGKHTSVIFQLLALLKCKNRADRAGVTPLISAAYHDMADVIHVICGEGDYSRSFNKRGLNALHAAAMAGKVKAIEALVEHGFDVNQTEQPETEKRLMLSYKRTALHFAALHGHILAVLTLIRLGADVEQKDQRGFSFFEYAVLSKDPEMLNVARELPGYQSNEHDLRLVCAAVTVNNILALEEMIVTRNINIDATDKNGWTALHYAAFCNSIGSVKILLGQRIDQSIQDERGCTALHYAAMQGHVGIIKQLESLGECLNEAGMTPLHLACKEGHLGAVIALRACSDLRIKNRTGLTAGQEALANNHAEIVEEMRSWGDESLSNEQCQSLPSYVKYRISNVVKQLFFSEKKAHSQRQMETETVSLVRVI
ncbi:MAG: ankyrin repeat domain-containing protein, partial [Gammaproteobacteria bacterium]|nr:ankyrin repeat domain-containing protein [Gammaproteobacteria bacterium]